MCSCWLVLWKILSTDRFWTRSDFLFSYMMRVMYCLDKRWICSPPKSSTAPLWLPQIKDWLPQRGQRSMSAAGRELHSCSALDLRARRAEVLISGKRARLWCIMHVSWRAAAETNEQVWRWQRSDRRRRGAHWQEAVSWWFRLRT